MTTVSSKDALRIVFEEAWSNGNLDVIDDYISSDFISHNSLGDFTGPDGYKQQVLKLRSAFPDIRFTMDALMSEGDEVMGRWTATATHQGPFMGVPPTGKQVTIGGVTTGRVVDGKAIEGWTYVDSMSLMRQLGALPKPQPVGS